MYIKGTPEGYEDAVEVGEGGWAVWKPPTRGVPPCPNSECFAPYNAAEPVYALECPECGEAGCSECFPSGRGCPCPACEDA